jgi:hypothetical protein
MIHECTKRDHNYTIDMSKQEQINGNVKNVITDSQPLGNYDSINRRTIHTDNDCFMYASESQYNFAEISMTEILS